MFEITEKAGEMIKDVLKGKENPSLPSGSHLMRVADRGHLWAWFWMNLRNDDSLFTEQGLTFMVSRRPA